MNTRSFEASQEDVLEEVSSQRSSIPRLFQVFAMPRLTEDNDLKTIIKSGSLIARRVRSV